MVAPWVIPAIGAGIGAIGSLFGGKKSPSSGVKVEHGGPAQDILFAEFLRNLDNFGSPVPRLMMERGGGKNQDKLAAPLGIGAKDYMRSVTGRSMPGANSVRTGYINPAVSGGFGSGGGNFGGMFGIGGAKLPWQQEQENPMMAGMNGPPMKMFDYTRG